MVYFGCDFLVVNVEMQDDLKFVELKPKILRKAPTSEFFSVVRISTKGLDL